jgi:hypothetical protein
MLSKSHGEKDKKKRKAKKNPMMIGGGVPTLTDSYNKADALVDLVYVDIANGVSRSEVIQKITKGVYEGMERPFVARTAAYYYNAALERFAEDRNIESEKLRDMFFGRYESLLQEAVQKGDLYNARGILDSMARIFGVEKKDAPQTAIQINNNKEGITVNFGFDDVSDET